MAAKGVIATDHVTRFVNAWIVPIINSLTSLASSVSDLSDELDEVKSSSGSSSSGSADVTLAEFEPYKITFPSNGSIVVTDGQNRTRTTVFNTDGSITETLKNASGTKLAGLKTVFNSDGSITASKV